MKEFSLGDSSSNALFSSMSNNSFRSANSLGSSAHAIETKNTKIKAYWMKKARRTSEKKVTYRCRQSLAKQRFRYQGRFIKKEELDKLDPNEIYNPNERQVPKTKQIFKITKEVRGRLRSTSASSENLFGESIDTKVTAQSQLSNFLTMAQSNLIRGPIASFVPASWSIN